MRSNNGAWIGWPGDTGDGPEAFDDDGLTLVPVPLSEQEVAEFYEGFSNDTLWPLYHDLVAKPSFHREWWDSYVTVNQRFADAAAKFAAKDAIVWVQDYQLQLVPAMLRELRPDLRIGFYLHIPFPPAELFSQLPWRRQILEGLLGADLVGFQLSGCGRRTSSGWSASASATRPTATRSTCPTGASYSPRRSRSPSTPQGFEELARSEPVAQARRADPRRPGQPEEGVPGHRPARLHQGHLRPAARVQRADRRRPPHRRGRRLRPGGDPVARARRPVPPAPRRHRPPGGPHQRRPRPHRPTGHLLPALLVPARGDGRPLPRRRHHGGDARSATA